MRRIKKITLITILLIATAALAISVAAQGQKITRENWTKTVCFSADLIKPGVSTVSKANMDQVKDMLTQGVQVLVNNYDLKFRVIDYRPEAPSDGYIDATNKGLGMTKLGDPNAPARQRALSGYTGGLPFPNPQTGVEVAWNYHYNYSGDDADNEFGVYWVSAKRGVERSEQWRWLYIVKSLNRSDIDPPYFEDMKKANIQYHSMTICRKPLDKKGFTALYHRFDEPKDQEGWIYVPQQRRATRFSFGTRGDAWNNTDMLYEDVRGYMGFAEWMTWELLDKKVLLAPAHSGTPYGLDNADKVFDFKNAPYWNPRWKWEPRPMYVVQATPKFRDYPYSKMVFYIDGETYQILIKEMWDKKGQLWKVQVNGFDESSDPLSMPGNIAGSLMVDLQSEHATAFVWHEMKANVGLEPSLFTLSELRKLAQ
ncbi:MAG: DUF1329 domain-containing protein [Candidatus Alcyoniella australis]|nr:DUF1329 domain-containing protein [Candidatus Alcyoniella australis]